MRLRRIVIIDTVDTCRTCGSSETSRPLVWTLDSGLDSVLDSGLVSGLDSGLDSGLVWFYWHNMSILMRFRDRLY